MVETNANPILWLPDVEDHDYLAAGSYLGLLHSDEQVTGLLERENVQLTLLLLITVTVMLPFFCVE